MLRFLADVSAFQRQAVKPVHQRWLPPSVVVLLCARLGLDQETTFQPIKSERHHPYLAFLHYLALAADFITVTPTAFQLTPTAWAWLSAAPTTRQQQLLDAWRTAPLALAQRFALPWEPLSLPARAFVLAQLTPTMHSQPQALTAVVGQWRLLDSAGLLPTPRPRDWRDETALDDPLHQLIIGPLHWLGLLTLLVEDTPVAERGPSGRAATAPRFFLGNAPPMASIPAAQCTMPKAPANTILAPLHVQPVHLVRLARFCTWTIAPAPTVLPHTFTLAPERIAQLAAQGVGPAQALATLTAALGRPPSRRISQRIRQWAQPGEQLRLRTLFVLEADTPERLAQLRRYKLVRNRLGETIAPNRISLRPADAQSLAQTLRTLGYYVEPPAPLPELVEGNGAATTLPSPELVEGEPVEGEPVEGEPEPVEEELRADNLSPTLQWFLITLYQGLGAHLPLPLDLPWSLRQALRGRLTAPQQADAEGAAQQLLVRLQAALAGYLQVPAWTMPATAEPEPLIQQALDAGHDIEIRYWGPADGQVTTRTVTPYWLEEHHQIRYLLGWCHLRQQERTFRLDRMEAVISQPRL